MKNGRKILALLLAFLLLGSGLASIPVIAEEEDNGNELTNDLFPAHDLGGVTIKAMDANSLNARNPEAEELEDFEIEERQARLDAIQEKYNVVIEFVPTPAVSWEEVPDEMIKRFVADDPVADIQDYSYQYMQPLLQNGVLRDHSDFIYDMGIEDRYLEPGTWQDEQYGLGTFVGGEGLLYNRDMIRSAGMEYEPNEMFAMGRWDYEEFEAYLEELNNNLPEGDYPFFIDPYYWFLFAPSANGTSLIAPGVGANYKDEAVVESLEFLNKLYQAGYVRDPDLNEDGNPSYWATPGNTFEQGVEVAMTHRASWQAAYLVDQLDFGFVPYPWGSNVTVDNVGEPDAYLTLSDNYAVTVFDAQMKSLTAGVEDKADPEGVFTMFMELINHDFIFGADDADDEIDPRWFSTELDAELYEWSLSRERLELYVGLARGGILSIADSYYDVFFENASVRGVLDAGYQADQNSLIEVNFVEGEIVELPDDEEDADVDEDAADEDVAEDEVDDEVVEDEVVEDEVTDDEVVEDEAADEENAEDAA